MAGDPESITSAVIIDPAFLGDVVFDAPLVSALKRTHPDCRIGLVVRPPADAIARAIPGVDRVHIFDKRKKDRGVSGLRRVAGELAEENYRLALIPHPSVRSTALAYLAGISDRRGNADGLFARIFLTTRYPKNSSDTFISERLKLLGRDNNQEVALAGTMRAGSEARSSSGRVRLGLVLGSQWATKQWPPEKAAELVRALDPKKYELILIGAENERPLFRALGPLENFTDAIGGTVDDLLKNIARCDLVLAGDTGPLHIARALGIPVVALFGPTPEARHTFTTRDRVLAIDIDCRPCSDHGAATCPKGHHRCLRDLSGERVLAAVEEVAG